MDAKLNTNGAARTPEAADYSGAHHLHDPHEPSRHVPRHGLAYTLAAALVYENGAADFDTRALDDMKISDAKRQFLLYLNTEGFEACDRARQLGRRSVRGVPCWWEGNPSEPPLQGDAIPDDDTDKEMGMTVFGGASGGSPDH